MIKFLIEAYENLMDISTVENYPTDSKIQIRVASDFLNDCLDILADMEKRFPMTRLDDNQTVSQGNY
ncbi:DUF4911 domain-containing protein [bacterium]|nr:DUF4911 domain-containing protein [bacterium]